MTSAERVWAFEWLDEALRLHEENVELRLLMTNLVVAIARNADTLAMANGEITERWPDA